MTKLLIIKKNVVLVSIIYLFIGCKKEQNYKSLFFEDFSFQCYCGLIAISPGEARKQKTQGRRFYELVYKGNLLDSMIVFNPWNKKAPVKFKCNRKDSVSVFETEYPAPMSVTGDKTYFYCDNHSFTVYQYLGVDGWLVHTVTSKRYSRGIDFIMDKSSSSKLRFDNIDTSGFLKKLIQRENLTIINSRVLRDTTVKLRITKRFTFNAWFEYDSL
ncbi:hypothetical protein [Mucilaginibacter sp.]|uniref:hypothetical protein n=1 Tax=Mucilaginibacter sp. TaxID=1882438 RepID=UPI0025F7CAA1|nr:hypothetical protein [Mucilaginibacter sp.]